MKKSWTQKIYLKREQKVHKKHKIIPAERFRQKKIRRKSVKIVFLSSQVKNGILYFSTGGLFIMIAW